MQHGYTCQTWGMSDILACRLSITPPWSMHGASFCGSCRIGQAGDRIDIRGLTNDLGTHRRRVRARRGVAHG
jgi:hypothetical protein